MDSPILKHLNLLGALVQNLSRCWRSAQDLLEFTEDRITWLEHEGSTRAELSQLIQLRADREHLKAICADLDKMREGVSGQKTPTEAASSGKGEDSLEGLEPKQGREN